MKGLQKVIRADVSTISTINQCEKFNTVCTIVKLIQRCWTNDVEILTNAIEVGNSF